MKYRRYPRGGGPPWHHHGMYGPHGGRGHAWRRRRRDSLRRRLTVAFAVVALGAVALTTWMTIGAVGAVQRELLDGRTPVPPMSTEEPADGGVTDRTGVGPGSDTAEAFRRISRTAFRAGVLSFVIAVFAAGAFTNFLTRPLHALTRGARRLEAGERGIRLAVPPGRDELGSLTEAFNALVAGLERQEEWRRNMTADIAHDLRTPLAVLRSEIEGMQDGVVPTDAAALERLHREVMLLARLIDDLRTLSQSEGAAQSLELGEVALEPLLRRSVEAFASRAAERGAEIVLASSEPRLTAMIDADRISQVISNLLDNALRYAGPVRIEVGADRQPLPAATEADDDGGEFVRVWVRDHGPGIPPDDLEQVFERFYRADSARSRTGPDVGAGAASGSAPAAGSTDPGSGLGLAIARAIVDAHGGSIGAYNHPDGGAVFELFLPVAG